jgi:uncharacterized integral membrane protein
LSHAGLLVRTGLPCNAAHVFAGGVTMSREPRSHKESRIRAAQTIRVVVWLVVLAVLVVFAALNTDKVSVDWAFDTTDVPLWLVIAISAVAGAVIGYLARSRRR